ncbi:late expression factor-11 [Maruca vitrata nucleopolyhedrovirus]|uniref:Late expression factor 11 n=1 Tax=Maruca vitrata nucleopolyhedrovirus TaxID=1307954 RepID=A1YR88_9ABAC|nr:late expression factor-11 [Maruca vitrata nucleopolyhedrovirus]ABL75978.1 late expression factor-11 [Maruca vitrata nucleopolyhedrovirus]
MVSPCQHSGGCDSDCLTRSEIQALFREVINTLKHTMKTENVCAHMLDISSFERIKEYIRANLGYFTVITDKCSKRKVSLHHKRIDRLLSIKKTYRQEYKRAVSKIYKNQSW